VTPAPRRLAGLRLRARAALLWEAAWPRAWPVLAVVGLFLLLALSGVFLVLPAVLHLTLLSVLIAALVVAAVRAARGFAVPGDAAADRRLERASGLAHRPLAALQDRPASGDDAALVLWQVHQAREAARIARLRVGVPRPGLAARDPRALRAGLAVALLAALVAAGPEVPERLRRALWPEGPPPAPGLAPRLEAWVTPPAYTGAPPIFLDAAGGAVAVPAGSRLRAALSGGSGTPALLRDGAPVGAFQPLGPGSHLAEVPLEAGGRVAIHQGGREVAAWSVTVQADAAPRIAWAEPPGPAARGLGIRLPWRAEDDWGVVSAGAELRLAARPDAPPLAVELPVPPGGAKAPRGAAQPDLSSHPWAGLPVRAVLTARDGAAQEGRSAEAALTLPERVFNHPVARGLILLRKGLSLDPSARGRAIEGLDRLAERPEAFEGDATTALALRSARGRLEDPREEAVGEAQATMWEAALALEEGRADRTARALAETRERLREALRERQQAERERAEARREADRADREREERRAEERRQEEARREGGEPRDEEAERQREAARQEEARQEETGQDAERQQAEQRQDAERDRQRAEAERRIGALREAVRRHLDALAERLQRENGEAPEPGQPPRARPGDRREAERRADRMRERNREDRPEEAERELAELERMLEALENGGMAEGQREERRQRRERGQQQMGVIQDMVRRESALLDGSHRRAESDAVRRERERRPAYPWNRAAPPEPPAAPAPDARAEARTQRALRRALGELMQQHGDLTGEVPAPLGRADQAMRESAEALEEKRDARPHQERAIRELSEGGRQMAQRMQRQFGRPQPGEPGEGEEGEGQGDALAEGGEQGGEGRDQMAENGEGRDPLGRRLREGTGTAEEGGDTRVPDEAEVLRTRRLQEELRRRHAERERPAGELDYIDRLLRLF